MVELVEARGMSDIRKDYRRTVNEASGGNRTRKSVFHGGMSGASARSGLHAGLLACLAGLLLRRRLLRRTQRQKSQEEKDERASEHNNRGGILRRFSDHTWQRLLRIPHVIFA